MSAWIPYIPVLPLAAFAINILCGRIVKHTASFISIAASVISCAIALPVCWQVAQGQTFTGKMLWLHLANYPLEFGYLVDPPAATLLFVVTVIGTLIQIYSTGYMHGDARYSRFFAYLSLFMSAMLALVIASNYKNLGCFQVNGAIG